MKLIKPMLTLSLYIAGFWLIGWYSSYWISFGVFLVLWANRLEESEL